MKFGVHMPTGSPLGTPDNLVVLATKAEALGFDLIAAGDHIVIPEEIESRYPYTRSRQYTRARRSRVGGGSGEWLEQMTLLSFLAAHTSRVRLLTSVMVIPHRSPVVAAKSLTTIDVLSKGRLILGCGVGWMREEFEAIGAPSFDERGAITDEYIRAYKELWTSDAPTFDGKYCQFSNLSFEPKPVQTPHPPIWIGGESTAALRRVGQLGDGWEPGNNHPAYPFETPEDIAIGLAKIRVFAEEAGRDPSKITVAYHNGVEWNAKEEKILPNGRRRSFTGTPSQIAEDIQAFEEVGVQHIVFFMRGSTMEEAIDYMESIALHGINAKV